MLRPPRSKPLVTAGCCVGRFLKGLGLIKAVFGLYEVFCDKWSSRPEREAFKLGVWGSGAESTAGFVVVGSFKISSRISAIVCWPPSRDLGLSLGSGGESGLPRLLGFDCHKGMCSTRIDLGLIL